MKKLIKYSTLYGICCVLILWQILSLMMASNVLPSPLEAIKSFIELLPTVLYKHILASIYRILLALLISLVIGILLGMACGLYKNVDMLLSPITYILYPLPKVAFLPLFMIFMGIGDASKVTLMISIIIFQILIAVRDGIKEIPAELFQSMKTLGLTHLQLYRHLIIPAMLPKLFSALRISLGISISALFFAENFATTAGIGYLIMNAWSMVDYPKMFAGIIALSLLGLIFFKCVDFLEAKCCPWLKA
nr:ABC transporter permease [uncultured Niameybacter sp.]